jgi:hypothetical protein
LDIYPHRGHLLQVEAAAMETAAVTAMETATAREDKLHKLLLRLHGLFTYSMYPGVSHERFASRG